MKTKAHPFHISIPFNAFKEVEKRMHYRYWDKQRERSNHAKLLAEAGPRGRKCLMKHRDWAYSGPPDDDYRTIVCLFCHAAATEPVMKARGFEWETITDWQIDEILDLDLELQARGQRGFITYR